MSIKKIIIGAVLGCGIASTSFAQTLTVGNVSGSPGGSVSVPLNFTQGTPIESTTFRIIFNPVAIGPVNLVNCGGGGVPNANVTTVCFSPNSGQINFDVTSALPGNQIETGSLGTLDFTIPGSTAPGTYTLVITNAVYADGSGAAVPGTEVNGAITLSITGAAGFDSTPAPGSIINLGSANVSTTVDTVANDITVSEIGDEQLNVTALAITGGSAGDFTAVTAPFNIADGGADVDVDLTCTPSARGNITASLDLTNNSINAPNATYELRCVGLSENVTVPAGPVAISGLTVDPNPLTAVFNVTNPQDGFTSAAGNVTVSAAGDGEITVAPAGPSVIAVGGTLAVTVSCDNAAAGTFNSTITVEWNDPVSGGTDSADVAAECVVTDSVPSYVSTPAVGSALAFGTVTNGVTSAPINIDVRNDGVGPAPASNLIITSATASNPQYSVLVTQVGPILIGADAGDVDISVTCTPVAGSSGPLPAATLTVVHNGDDSPSSYPLTCSGVPDGDFSSNPLPGGILNLGVVPPNTTTPPGTIDFFNNGTTDAITVSCTFDDPDGVFTFTPNPIDFVLGPGTTESAVFQCTPTGPQSFEGTLGCFVDDVINGGPPAPEFSYSVICQGQPLVVPTMNQWGLIIMSLMLLLAGGLFGRRWFATQA